MVCGLGLSDKKYEFLDNDLYLRKDLNYKSVCICQNSLNGALKILYLIIFKFDLNKK
jgi:hypothetical protein